MAPASSDPFTCCQSLWAFYPVYFICKSYPYTLKTWALSLTPRCSTLTQMFFSHLSAATAFQMLVLLLLYSKIVSKIQAYGVNFPLYCLCRKAYTLIEKPPLQPCLALVSLSGLQLYTGSTSWLVSSGIPFLKCPAQSLPNPFYFHLIAFFPLMDSPGHYLQSLLYLLECWALHFFHFFNTLTTGSLAAFPTQSP